MKPSGVASAVPTRLLALLPASRANVVPRSDELGDDAAVFIADVSGFSALECRAEAEGEAGSCHVKETAFKF